MLEKLKSSATLPNDGASYAKVIVNGDRKHVKRLALPFAVGSSAACDVIVNSRAVAPLAKIVLIKDGALQAYDLKTNKFVGRDALQSYGVKVIGPFAMAQTSGIDLTRMLNEWLVRERLWFESVKQPWKKYLGGDYPQNLRLSLWGVCGLVALLLLSFIFKDKPQVVVDRSKAAISLTYGDLHKDGIGSVPAYREFAKGVSFQVNLSSKQAKIDHGLSFELKGIDQAKEVEIFIANRKIFSSKVLMECVSNYCSHTVMMKANNLKPGDNLITLKHQPKDSDYVIRNILVDELRGLSAGELIAVQRLYAGAERGFQEIGIAYANGIKAREDLMKLNKVITGKASVEEWRSKSDSLMTEIERTLKTMSDDLWFKAERDMELGNFEDAKLKYDDLLLFYPDSATKEHVLIKENLKRIAELL